MSAALFYDCAACLFAARLVRDLTDSPCATERFAIVARVEVIDPNATGLLARRVNELTAADIHAYVRDAAARRVKEHEVARLHAPMPYGMAGMKLFRGGPGQRNAFPTVDIFRKPGAIESTRPRRSPPIGRAAIRVCGADYIVRRARRLCLGPDTMRVVRFFVMPRCESRCPPAMFRQRDQVSMPGVLKRGKMMAVLRRRDLVEVLLPTCVRGFLQAMMPR